jgi:hypothetical protein
MSTTDYEARRRAKIAKDPEYAARRMAQRSASRNTPKDTARKLERAATRREQIGSTYVTGKPCIRGHMAPRYSGNQTCVECTREDRVGAEERRKARRDSDPEYGTHRRLQRAVGNRGYRKRNRGKKNAEHAKWLADKLQRTPKWADLKMIRKIYDTSTWITKVTGLEHHVDHIIPMRGKFVSGLHIAENLRVLPGPENLAKGSKFMP